MTGLGRVRRGLTGAALGVVLALLAGAGAAGAVGASAPVAETDPGAGGPSAAPPAPEPGDVIDNTSRAAVRTSYLDDLGPALAVPQGWSGTVSPCAPGAPSAAAQQAAFDAVNWYRDLAGLQPVSEDASLSAKAQQAALMMKAQNALSHDPDPGWACYTADGDEAAGRSNLSLGHAGARAVAGQVEDGGFGNRFVGHRRWILHPPLQHMGSGSTNSSNALWVNVEGETFDHPRPAGPDYVAWPPPGFFPIQEDPNGRWSFSGDPGECGVEELTDLSGAAVTITAEGEAPFAVPASQTYHSGGFCSAPDPTVSWDFAPQLLPSGGDRTYHVRIDGIVRDGTPTSHEYDVTLFDADEPTDPAEGCRPPEFPDVGVLHPFFLDVCWMVDQGVTTGYGDGTYKPSAPVSRGAMSAFMYRLAGEPPFAPPGTPSFSDVPASFAFFDEVEWMAEVGITTGYADGTYKPGAPVSRQAMSAFMYRLAGAPEFADPGGSTFDDVPTSHPFFTEIEWMVFEAITDGFTDGGSRTYQPGAAVSRQAMSAFMHRLADGPGVGV